MKDNIVSKFFIEFARFEGIEINHKWKSAIFKKIGKQIGMGKADLISTWIARGNIPSHAAGKIMALDLPDHLKSLCRQCIKSSYRDDNTDFFSVSESTDSYIILKNKLEIAHRKIKELEDRCEYLLKKNDDYWKLIERLTSKDKKNSDNEIKSIDNK